LKKMEGTLRSVIVCTERSGILKEGVHVVGHASASVRKRVRLVFRAPNPCLFCCGCSDDKLVKAAEREQSRRVARTTE
jgi:hypothetical protein